jgi:SPX domain protein involved in polyphosphate accumulation
MKFGVHLLSDRTPEWNSQYIQYEYMKELLEKAVAAAPISIDDDDNSAREQYFLQVDEAFFEVTITMYQSISICLFIFL